MEQNKKEEFVQGRIYKGIGGFYYVDTERGVYTCKARGKFRNESTTPCVGDFVTVQVTQDAQWEGTLHEIHARKNMLIRPPVSNIDCVALVIAAKKPAPNYLMADKILTICESQEISVLLCINKEDLGESEETLQRYQPCGYPLFVTSAQERTGLGELVGAMEGKVTVFAGNSGVGKSSLLNALYEDFALETGEVSDKIERGRHTTRHVEFFKLPGGGYVADTPGFSRLDLYDIQKDNLAACFAEFRPYLGDCMFHDCSHTKEKGCAVLEAVSEGNIHPQRHANYVALYDELKQIKPWEDKTTR